MIVEIENDGAGGSRQKHGRAFLINKKG